MTDPAPAHRPTAAAIVAAMTPFFGLPLGVLVFALTRPSDDEGLVSALSQAWAEGGWPMYLVLASTALVSSVSAGLLFFGVQQGSSAVLAIAPLASLASAAGVAGAVIGMRTVTEVLGLVSPADRAALLAAGTGETLNASAFGFACAAGVLVASAAGVLLGSMAQRAEARRLLFVASVTFFLLGLVMGTALLRLSKARQLLRVVVNLRPIDRLPLMVAGSDEISAYHLSFLGLVGVLLVVLAVGAVVLKSSPRIAVLLPVLGLGGLLGPGLAATANALVVRQPTSPSTVTQGVLVELPGNAATGRSVFCLGKNTVSKCSSSPTESLRITGDTDLALTSALEGWVVNANDQLMKERALGLTLEPRRQPLGLAVEVVADAATWWAFVSAAFRAEVVELELIGEAHAGSVNVMPELAALSEVLAVTRRSVPLRLSLEPLGSPAEVSGESLLVDGQTWTAAALTSPGDEPTATVSIRADPSMRPQTVVQLALAAAAHQRALVLIMPVGAPPPDNDAHEVDEGLVQAAIKQVVMQHVAEVRFCYERELKNRPGLEGRVVVTFSIGLEGKVGEVQVDENVAGSEMVGTCVATRIKTWQFQRPTGGEPIEVRYPFVFTPAR